MKKELHIEKIRIDPKRGRVTMSAMWKGKKKFWNVARGVYEVLEHFAKSKPTTPC